LLANENSVACEYNFSGHISLFLQTASTPLGFVSECVCSEPEPSHRWQIDGLPDSANGHDGEEVDLFSQISSA